MNTVKTGDRVKVIYTICLENGARFRPLHPGDTLEFTTGSGAVLPGFERAVLEMAEGETRLVKVPAADAYGPRRPDKVFTVPRGDVRPQIQPLKVGDVVRVASSEEGEFFAIVRDVTSTEILLDANHPLCGQDITFEIQVLEVSPPAFPSAERRRNGSVHATSGM